MKGVSPLIATIMIIAIVVGGIAIVANWYSGLLTEQATFIGEKTEETVECKYGGIRVLTETIRCDFSGNASQINPEYLNFSVENSGSINLYDLRVQIFLQGRAYGPYTLHDSSTNLSFTENFPLRPNEIKTVFANITEDLSLADADWILVITQCSQPKVSSGKIEDVDCTP